MFASLAGIGLRSSFPPTVILCFISFATSFSIAPGLLTLQPQTNSRAPASKRFHAVGISFPRFFAPGGLRNSAVSRTARYNTRVRWGAFGDTGIHLALSSFGFCLDLINTITRQRECIASRIIKGADGASLGDRSSVASETGPHQSDRSVLGDGAVHQRAKRRRE